MNFRFSISGEACPTQTSFYSISTLKRQFFYKDIMELQHIFPMNTAEGHNHWLNLTASKETLSNTNNLHFILSIYVEACLT